MTSLPLPSSLFSDPVGSSGFHTTKALKQFKELQCRMCMHTSTVPLSLLSAEDGVKVKTRLI